MARCRRRHAEFTFFFDGTAEGKTLKVFVEQRDVEPLPAGMAEQHHYSKPCRHSGGGLALRRIAKVRLCCRVPDGHGNQAVYAAVGIKRTIWPA